ncbi:MAG TPA: ionic transporter y4hA, partial [Hyphomicrobium sp.]|nr:ionic transporter y4hA [Hyphomicrobium sp.]
MTHSSRIPAWTWLLPIAGIALFVVATFLGFDENFASSTIGLVIAASLIPLLIGAVFASVYHAEDAAHQTGEPIGTLILTIAVTVIELALIVALMISGKASLTLVRDTVYAVIMIIMTGVVGLCISVGGLRYREQEFDIRSTKIYLAVLIVMASLTLLLPNYTRSAPDAQFSEVQLAFISVVALALYGVFLFTQTVLHKNYF